MGNEHSSCDNSHHEMQIFNLLPDDVIGYCCTPLLGMPIETLFAIAHTCHRFRTIVLGIAPTWKNYLQASWDFENCSPAPLLEAQNIPQLVRAICPNISFQSFRWSPDHVQRGAVLDATRTVATRVEPTGASMIRADTGFRNGLHIWEVEIVHEGNGPCSKIRGSADGGSGGRDIYIGCTAQEFQKDANELLASVGYSYDRWGWLTSSSLGRTIDVSPYTERDVILVRLDLDQRTISYCRNGVPLTHHLRLTEPIGTTYYPAVSLYTKGDSVRLRFQPSTILMQLMKVRRGVVSQEAEPSKPPEQPDQAESPPPTPEKMAAIRGRPKKNRRG
ncbi:hypothetical protein PAPYR_5405 [Paratrimastix pyriformis]|uniref:B30.2/SPRY domain-containing protein n=1 Tax=Paratrimastix pyriformis TaxID=342808 RepID=A0ABQ8UJ90_9EUKA|nr:hypothetical protein PAPYR_5405 [Paratrimastix pyriformis]